VATWGNGFGSWAQGAGDGNAAGFDRSIGGFIAGLDLNTADAWRGGVAIGYQGSGIAIDQRNSTAAVAGYNLAAYGGLEEGPFSFHAGGALTLQSVDTTRRDAFSGFDETLTAHYGARTAQVFGEAAYHRSFGGLAVDPFIGLSGIAASTDGFTESGGLAALSAAPETRSITLADFGARFAADLPAAGAALRLTATVAWQHAFGDVIPTADLAFGGGTPFTIAGVPIARDALLLKAGFDWRLTPRANVGLAYSGQIASGIEDHGLDAHLVVRF
jgi:outer membrane autotransporter protein